jgi:hypothetical protein
MDRRGTIAQRSVAHNRAAACHAGVDALRIAAHADPALARIKLVGAGEDFEEQRVVAHRHRHGADVINRPFNRGNAGIGHQAIGGLHADRARERRRHANRAALVRAKREIRFAGHQHRGAAA